jgi:predicted deacetylase
MIKASLKRMITKSIHLPIPLSLSSQTYQLAVSTISLKEKLASFSYVYFNINFDDQCTVYKQLSSRDYGGRVDEGLSLKLKGFLEKNYDVAITSFIIPNYKGNTRKYKDKFILSDPKYSDWISHYGDLANKYKFECALHGYFHMQKENPFFQSHTEFAFKTQQQALETIKLGIGVFNEIGWPITGFRQPGWDLSTLIDLPAISKITNLKYIAANSYNAGYNAHGFERVSNFYPTLIDGVINFPQNIEIDWPLDRIFKTIDYLVGIKALISIKAHFVDRDVTNCLNEENFIKLYKLIDYCRSKFKDKIQFATLDSIANHLNNTNI